MFWPKAEADKYKTCLVICENQETYAANRSLLHDPVRTSSAINRDLNQDTLFEAAHNQV